MQGARSRVPLPLWARACAWAGLLAALVPAGQVAGGTVSALTLPPTHLAYRIEARLDPKTRALDGRETITFTNTLAQPVATLPLHLYLNAFANTRTTWVTEASREHSGELQRILNQYPDPWGHTEPDSLVERAGGSERNAAWRYIRPDDGNPMDRSLAEIHLPLPVAPGETAELVLAFHARLPAPIARTGGTRDFFMVAQWYPKLAAMGFDAPAGPGAPPAPPPPPPHQFHGVTEFFADFADYDVALTVPEGWLVGATGREAEPPGLAGSGWVRHHYAQREVHDFALVTGSHLSDQILRHLPAGGGPAVDVRYITPRGTEHQIPRWQRAVEGAMDAMGTRVGPYPYTTLTVVLPPYADRNDSGMEYPTLITGLPGDPLWDRYPLDRGTIQEITLAHEFGHQYFYGVLATDEQEEAYLDEGLNTYWQDEALEAIYGSEAPGGIVLGREIRPNDGRTLGLEDWLSEIREPLRKRPSWLFEGGTWEMQIYERPALTIKTAARLFGREAVDQVFAEYYRRFAFRHPQGDDFLAVVREAGGADMESMVREGFERARMVDYRVTRATAEPWKPPLGRVPQGDSTIEITRADRDRHPEAGLEEAAREDGGAVLLEITDPGWFRRGDRREGQVIRRAVEPGRGTADPAWKKGKFYESFARFEGPAWDRLPVQLSFQFADGAVVKDLWDGRATWRRYRFVRPAPLTVAWIDSLEAIAVDVKPQDDALAVRPDRSFTADWSLWLSAAAEWCAGVASLWL